MRDVISYMITIQCMYAINLFMHQLEYRILCIIIILTVMRSRPPFALLKMLGRPISGRAHACFESESSLKVILIVKMPPIQMLSSYCMCTLMLACSNYYYW